MKFDGTEKAQVTGTLMVWVRCDECKTKHLGWGATEGEAMTSLEDWLDEIHPTWPK